MPEYKLMLGKGLQFLVITLSVVLLLTLGAWSGITWYKSEQNESTAEVMSIDSREGIEIAEETKKTRNRYNDKIQSISNNIVTDTGHVTPDFMLYLESARSDAISRGDSSSIYSKITHP